MNLYQKLFAKDKGSLFLLIDPDKSSPESLAKLAKEGEEMGIDAILIGGSLISNGDFDFTVKAIKENVNVPVVLFPGNHRQVSIHADGIFFMSLISGRNPQYLIGEQVMAAPIVVKSGLEAISVAYMLIESGTVTSAEFISDTKPIPRAKVDIAVAHALAAKLLGMKAIYLESGSGAGKSVPLGMISAVSSRVNIPVIVGGGITDPSQAKAIIDAGAKAVVIGTIVEKLGASVIKQMAEAIKS